MNKTDLIFNMLQQELQQQKLRLSRNYAQGLATLMHIDPNAKNLIALLGTGHEKSNLDALSKWVYQRLQESVASGASQSSVEDFRKALMRELMDLQA